MDEDPASLQLNRTLIQRRSTLQYYIIISLLLLINPAISLIIGVIYKDQCVIDQRIPIYMIVFGVFGTMLVILLIILHAVCRRSDRTREMSLWLSLIGVCMIGFAGLNVLFLFAWLIAGSVFTFSIRYSVQHSDPSLPTYCHGTLYYFTFWGIIITYGTPCVVLIIALVKACIELRQCFRQAVNPTANA